MLPVVNHSKVWKKTFWWCQSILHRRGRILMHAIKIKCSSPLLEWQQSRRQFVQEQLHFFIGHSNGWSRIQIGNCGSRAVTAESGEGVCTQALRFADRRGENNPGERESVTEGEATNGTLWRGSLLEIWAMWMSEALREDTLLSCTEWCFRFFR